MEMTKEQLLEIINSILDGKTFEYNGDTIKVIEKQEEKPKPWKPVKDEHFYIVGTGDGTEVENWIWWNYDSDNTLYEMGECFATKEEAKFEAARRKFMKCFKDVAYEVNEPNKVLTHYPVWTGLEVTMIESSDPCWYGGETVGFTSKEAFYKAMELINQGELRKYYFRLPEDYWN